MNAAISSCFKSAVNGSARNLVASSDSELGDCGENDRRLSKLKRRPQVLSVIHLAAAATTESSRNNALFEFQDQVQSRQCHNEESSRSDSKSLKSTVINVEHSLVGNEPQVVANKAASNSRKQKNANTNAKRSQDELCTYQFWKCVRTELVAALVFVLITSHATITARLAFVDQVKTNLADDKHEPQPNQHQQQRTASIQVHLVWGATQAALAATLTQVFGQVSGCHLTVGVSLALFVKSHIKWPRLVAYAAAQALGALLGAGMLLLLTSSELLQTATLADGGRGHFSFVSLALPDAKPPPANCSSQQQDSDFKQIPVNSNVLPANVVGKIKTSSLAANTINYCLAAPNEGQMFAMQLIASSLLVLTFLVNADKRRTDAGFRALSIGLAYFVCSVLCTTSGGFFASPTHLVALALAADEWRPHWVSHLLAPLVGGLFAALSHEYIDFTSASRKHLPQRLRRSFNSLPDESLDENADFASCVVEMDELATA